MDDDETCTSCRGTGFDPVMEQTCCCQPYDYDEQDTECANCGGEGFTYGCSWDWQCDTYDEGEGTCLCTRRCEWCNPLTAEELAERKKLQDILATALAKDKIAEIRQEQPK